MSVVLLAYCLFMRFGDSRIYYFLISVEAWKRLYGVNMSLYWSYKLVVKVKKVFGFKFSVFR